MEITCKDCAFCCENWCTLFIVELDQDLKMRGHCLFAEEDT
jgi:hypothetical protein